MSDSKRAVFKSTLAIDLGARHTGAFLVNHPAGKLPDAADCSASTVVMPREHDKISYSQKDRTACRHRRRGNKRYKMARRLLLLVVRSRLDEKKIVLAEEEERKLCEALCGLLKRRGYTWMDSGLELDRSCLDNLDEAVFAEEETLSEFFHVGTRFIEQWDALSQSPQNISRIKDLIPDDRTFKNHINSNFPELSGQIKEYCAGLRLVRDEAKALDRQYNLGHKHRTRYMQDIRADMQRDSRLRPAVQAFDSTERLWKLVCNISNLQMRALRWYFNDPAMASGDVLTPERLQKVLVRAFKYFHPDSGQASRRLLGVIHDLEKSGDIVETLCTMDPERTIPVFEDQNNRRPPNDMTLFLSPDRLNSRYGRRWILWSRALEGDDPVLGGELDVILALTDRKSRLQNRETEDYRCSYILQRVLDRSKKNDRFHLRALASHSTKQEADAGRLALSGVIGPDQEDAFVEFAGLYYSEVSLAKSGLWENSETALLERADIHPPMKKRILNNLVGDLFSRDSRFGYMFISRYWNMKVPGKGRSTVRTICQSIEAARKKHGNEFNYKYKSFCRALGRAKKVPAADKEFKSVHDNIEFLKTYFSSLGLDDRTVQRVCNPFSLAQLYTLIECEVDGFTSVSLAAHLENHWRMTEDGDGTGARCSRLPADCVRPFDGVLRKLLDRVAYELARETSEQLFARVPGRNTDIDMSVIIESNKFAFSASIADIKKNAFAQKKADEADKRQLARWQDKDERIRQAARGLCAYTGAQLGEDGEYDHIIPRSQTSGMGTVFNSEANLIYVSQKGNQLKGSRRYTLYDLDKGYLQAVFGTADTASVEGRIEETVLRLAETGDIRFFDRLKPEEQAAVRHALFLNASSEAFAAVVREINASNRTRVNGTQAYMVRAYREKICRLTADWCAANNNRLYFRNCWKVDAEQTSMLRTHLGEIDPALFKYEPQPIASHSIDAMCAYAVACGNAAACDLIGGDPDFSNAESYTADASLPTLHPGECKFINVRARDASQKTDFFAKPVFKEGILSENFLHILEKNGNVYVGFTVPGGSGDNGNCIQVAGKDPTQLLKDIEAYLDREVVSGNGKVNCYKIAANKAYPLFSRIALADAALADAEKKAAAIIRSLCYYTQQVPVCAYLTDKSGKNYESRENAVKGEDFTIAVKPPKGIKLPYKISGSVLLPAKAEWDGIVCHDDLARIWGNPIGDFKLEAWLTHRMNINSRTVMHAPVHRLVSLPMLCKDSGAFRIRRRSMNGESVYQICNINGVKYSSFAAENEMLKDKKPIIFPRLVNHTLTPVDIEDVRNDAPGIAMDAWRKLYSKNSVSVHMAPGTRTRAYIRIEMPFAMFQSIFKASGVENIPDSPLMLPSSIKIRNFNTEPLPDEELSAIIGAPRDSVCIETAGDTVVFSYTAATRNQKMLEAYNSLSCQ